MVKRYNGSEISHSIISKVKHALELKKTPPQNGKICSQNFWNEVVDIVGESMNCSPELIARAKARYAHYMEEYYPTWNGGTVSSNA